MIWNCWITNFRADYDWLITKLMTKTLKLSSSATTGTFLCGFRFPNSHRNPQWVFRFNLNSSIRDMECIRLSDGQIWKTLFTASLSFLWQCNCLIRRLRCPAVVSPKFSVSRNTFEKFQIPAPGKANPKTWLQSQNSKNLGPTSPALLNGLHPCHPWHTLHNNLPP